MKPIENYQQFDELVQECKNQNNQRYNGTKKHLVVCGDTGCAANKSFRVKEEIDRIIINEKLEETVIVSYSGCFGLCSQGPFIKVYPEGTLYRLVKPSDVQLIIEKDVKLNQVVDSLLYTDPVTKVIYPQQEKIPFYNKQKRIALSGYHTIDPHSLEEYIGIEGYVAFMRVLNELSPEEVIKQTTASVLRGRGGGGFLTGKKWQFARAQKETPKYLICNLDEGDPGAFMDRSIAERTPHLVLEGMLIAAYAIGATEGFIYVRAEYPLAVKRLQLAIEQAVEARLLGEKIANSDFSFKIEIRLGAGAFVCGEETALMNSIEGKRGMPRSKPPYPAIKGLWGKPTVINNVETFANLPFIFRKGGLEEYLKMGTEKSRGTKVFSLAGKVRNIGLVEVPMGTTLRELIFDIGGGIPNNKKFKAIQTGGPSGGCLVDEDIDTPIDYDNLTARGSMMGSGGAIVMDEDNCMVDVARFYMDFICDESCGKCSPCRIGTTRMKEILDKIVSGNATLEDLDTLKELAYYIKDASLCGLGQTAPNPVLSTLAKFHDEYMAHVVDKKCPAKVCKSLINFHINPDTCKKCGICAGKCPAQCISGVRGKEAYVIDTAACIKCGTCISACPFGVISRV